jgi:hypothetical protein
VPCSQTPFVWDVILRSPLKIIQRFAGGASRAICFTLVSCLAYSSTLKMEAAFASETFVDFQHNHCCKNLKPYIHGLCSSFNARDQF